MSRLCPRCGRRHFGICGIPAPISRINTPGSTIRSTNPMGDSYAVDVNLGQRRSKAGSKMLEELLAEARRQEKQVLNALKATSSDIADYDHLVHRLDKLHALVVQLNGQIVARRAGA